MARAPYVPTAYTGRSSAFESQRHINLYPELSNGANDKGIGMLVGTPGLRLFSMGIANPTRSMISFNGLLYIIQSNKFMSVTDDGTITTIGTLDTSHGRISMSQNGLLSAGIGGNQICFVDGSYGYIYNVVDGTFGKVDPSTFPPNPAHIEFIDSYFIVTNNTMNTYASEPYDGLNWNPIATTPVQAASDNIQNVINSHQQLFFIKQYSTEVFYNNATPTSLGFPFTRLSGAVIDYGTPAPWSVARGNNSMFFLANERDGNGIGFVGVVEMNSYTPIPITPPSIVYTMGRSSNLSNCFGYCYSDEGHTFYVITNPDDDWTFVYDTTTQMWHERSTGVGTTTHRHSGDGYVNFNNRHIVSDYLTNNLYQMSSQYNTDAGMPIICEMRTQHIMDPNSADDVFVDELQLDVESGVGVSGVNVPAVCRAYLTGDGVSAVVIDAGLWGADYQDNPVVSVNPVDGNGSGAVLQALVYNGSLLGFSAINHGTGYTKPPEIIAIGAEVKPNVAMSFSKDGGKTWSKEYIKSMGNIGEYRKRVIWRSLGRCKNWVFKFRISDPVKRIIMGIYIEASK